MSYIVKIGYYSFEFVSFEEAGKFAVAAKQHITSNDSDTEVRILITIDSDPDVAN